MNQVLNLKFSKSSIEEYYPIKKYREVAKKCNGADLISQMTYLDTKLFLPGINLAYSDKSAMAASVESRPPLIDVELVEFASRLPPKYKINGKIQKYLLKKLLKGIFLKR